MVIYAKEHNIIPETDCTKALSKLLKSLAKTDEKKTLIFDKGTYYLNRKNCPYIYRAITNTTSADEYADPAQVNMHYIPFLIENVKNLTLDGSGSTFVIDGKVTNAVVSGCENVTLKNIKIKTIKPNMHKFTVLKQTPFTTEFKLWSESKYEKHGNNFFFVGNGYKRGFFENKNTSFWNAGIKPDFKNNIFRINHPFMLAYKIKETKPYHFKVYYPWHKKFQTGQTLYVFDAHRSDVGIFVEKSKNITLNNVEQNFNYSLALVLQDCENVTVTDCTFAPEKGSEAELASLADFIQVCMCSGKIVIKNNIFDGSADDALNVHGIHFPVEKIAGNTVTVFMRHPQSWGFNPLHGGDCIEFINPKTLLSEAKNKIISSTSTGNRTIELVLEKAVPESYIEYVIEDTDRCPELVYENNTLNRIITRGILYTSRGKCQIINNRFVNTTMSSIHIADDAANWYESGMCLDVTIKNNIFDYCGKTPVSVKPENIVRKGAVHKNIKILNNTFKRYKGSPIKMNAVKNVEISGNQFQAKEKIRFSGCTNVRVNDNYGK